jgi:hypothetical protein
MVARANSASSEIENGLEIPEALLLRIPATKIFLAFFLIYSLINAFVYSIKLTSLRLSADDLAAMDWIKGNTAESSRFLVVDMGGEFNMPLQEWLPALTGRVNPGVVQGYEWLEGKQFPARMKRLDDLSLCSWEGLECVESWAAKNHIAYDYIIIRYQPYDYDYLREQTGTLLAYTLSLSPCYQWEYQNEALVIYMKTDD